MFRLVRWHGCLGFEALSRNAESCTFVENNPSTFQKLIENKENLKADNAIIKKIHADFFIKNNAELFDIIFFDPPFVLRQLYPTNRVH